MYASEPASATSLPRRHRPGGDRSEEVRLPEVARRLTQPFGLADRHVEREVLVRTTASAAWVLERRPMDDALVVRIRIARGGKARPVPRDGSEEPEILRVQDVRRRGWTVVGAEQEVPVDPVNDLIAGHRWHFTLEGVLIDGSPGALDQPRDSADFAHRFDVAGQL